MIRKLIAGAFCAFAIVASANDEAPVAAQPAAPAAEQAPAKPEVVCREQTVPGTRFAKKICTTREPRAEQQKKNEGAAKSGSTTEGSGSN